MTTVGLSGSRSSCVKAWDPGNGNFVIGIKHGLVDFKMLMQSHKDVGTLGI